MPSCQLYVEWTGQQDQPVQLVHRVKLLGAKEPNNFFLMRPPALQRSQGYHWGLACTNVEPHRVVCYWLHCCGSVVSIQFSSFTS